MPHDLIFLIILLGKNFIEVYKLSLRFFEKKKKPVHQLDSLACLVVRNWVKVREIYLPLDSYHKKKIIKNKRFYFQYLFFYRSNLNGLLLVCKMSSNVPTFLYIIRVPVLLLIFLKKSKAVLLSPTGTFFGIQATNQFKMIILRLSLSSNCLKIVSHIF